MLERIRIRIRIRKDFVGKGLRSSKFPFKIFLLELKPFFEFMVLKKEITQYLCINPFGNNIAIRQEIGSWTLKR